MADPPTFAHGLELVETACTINPAECLGIGQMYALGVGHVPRNSKKAAERLARACETEGKNSAWVRGWACRQGAAFFREGWGVRLDVARADALSGRADAADVELFGANVAAAKKQAATSKAADADAAMHASLDASPDALELGRLKNVVVAGDAATHAAWETRHQSVKEAEAGRYDGAVAPLDTTLATEGPASLARLKAIVADIRSNGARDADAKAK
jgi:hypothetical protein